jgi:hypothetical protein
VKTRFEPLDLKAARFFAASNSKNIPGISILNLSAAGEFGFLGNLLSIRGKTIPVTVNRLNTLRSASARARRECLFLELLENSRKSSSA